MINSINKNSNELCPDEILKMSKSITHLQRIHLGGGEPFMQKNISQKACIIANNWDADVICIPTNGWFTDNILNLIKEFGESSSKILRLHFSLNAPDRSLDSFTGVKNSFSRWQDTIKKAKKSSQKYKNISIIGLVTYGSHEHKDYLKIKDYLINEVGVDDFSLQLVRKHGDYQPEVDYNLFDSQLKKYFQNESKQNPFLRAFRQLIREYTVKYNLNPQFIVPCYAGVTRIVMSPAGNIYPCETLGYPNGSNLDKWLMGNIRDFDYDLKKLLNSPKAKEIKNSIRKSNCHCDHGIDLSLNLLNNNFFKIKLLFKGIYFLLKKKVKSGKEKR